MSDSLMTKVNMPLSALEVPHFRFVAAGEMPIKPVAWLIHRYLEKDTLAVMFGPPGKGKSFIALDLSCCIATDTAFHGLPVAQGAVFYIAGEGHNGIARRLSAWAVLNSVSLEGAPLFISEGPTNLASAANAAKVAEAVQALADKTGAHPELIVIDTLARNFGGDENSATEVGQFVRHVDIHLRHRWKATTLIVHHSGKDGERGARGSSALKGAADAEYEVSRHDDDKLIRLTARKMKDADEPPPLAFELVSVPVLDNTGSPIGAAALRSMAYSLPATPAKSGMGKNQQRALVLLEGLHSDIAGRLARQGRDDLPVLIEHEDWRQRCEDDGIQRNRYKEARDALEKRRAIRLEGPHVFLLLESVRNVRTPLGDSDDSDALDRVPFGQIGPESD